MKSVQKGPLSWLLYNILIEWKQSADNRSRYDEQLAHLDYNNYTMDLADLPLVAYVLVGYGLFLGDE